MKDDLKQDEALLCLSPRLFFRLHRGHLELHGSNTAGLRIKNVDKLVALLDVFAEPITLSQARSRIGAFFPSDVGELISSMIQVGILELGSNCSTFQPSVYVSATAALMSEIEGLLTDKQSFPNECANVEVTLALMAATIAIGKTRCRASAQRDASAERFRSVVQKMQRPVRLNMGSGLSHVAGWLNIDKDAHADITFDFTQPWPLNSGSVDAIYFGHVLEHLELDDVLQTLREARRVLSDGGALRVVVPDAALWLQAYVKGDQSFFTAAAHAWPHWPVGLGRLDIVMEYLGAGNGAERLFGHRSAFDLERLSKLLKQAGFTAVTKSSYMTSKRHFFRIDDHMAIAKNTSTPDQFSLFVEAECSG